LENTNEDTDLVTETRMTLPEHMLYKILCCISNATNFSFNQRALLLQQKDVREFSLLL